MIPVQSVAQVFDDLQRTKAGAQAFCTNFFPIQSRLQGWVEHGEFFSETRRGVVFFFRRERGLAHLHYFSPSPERLAEALPGLESPGCEPMVVDLVGPEAALDSLARLFQSSGFRDYRRLVRLARPAQALAPVMGQQPSVEFATSTDTAAVLALLESAFDIRADQIPLDYELEQAIAHRQIFLIRRSGEPGALLFFETQGATSTVRFWAVAPAGRSLGLGSAVIRHYFSAHPTVRRFLLWVGAENTNAIEKYRHYGYGPDGLVDRILLNEPGKK